MVCNQRKVRVDLNREANGGVENRGYLLPPAVTC